MSLPTLSGVHHVTFAVPDLDAGTAWYETVLRARRDPGLDHRDAGGALFAVILRIPGLDVPVQLRLAPDAAPTAGFGPVTFGVRDDAELQRWVSHLDGCGVPHSPVTTARTGLSVQFAAPGGMEMRLFTDPVGGFDAAAPPPSTAATTPRQS